jgi:hypothetical protein
MKQKTNCYLLTIPGGTIAFMGGPLQPAGADHVWLCSPSGERLLRAPKAGVSLVAPEELAGQADGAVEPGGG